MREVERLSLQQLCGQLLLIGYHGKEPGPALLQRVRESALGGVILFGRNVDTPEQVLESCRALHRAAPSGYPIFAAVDQEGGRVQRLRQGVLQVPPMRALGSHDDPEFTRAVANVLGRQLLALGFNLNFAPVADVDSNPKNPVIGDRSFGSDPARVVRHARAFAAGLESAGIVPCIKHYPGHGDTALDSHLELPTVAKSATELRRLELYPFERLAPLVHGVMTAHVVFPAFDRAPATLSGRLLSLLRSEFGFEGVVFSDDLEMGALSKHASIEENAVQAIEAGCDMLLICQSAELQARAHAALLERASSDKDFRARCERAVERSLVLRQRFPQRPAKRLEALQEALSNGDVRNLTKELSSLPESATP